MTITKVVKRDGKLAVYDSSKIVKAIEQSNKEVRRKFRASKEDIEKVIEEVESTTKTKISIEEIQDIVEETLAEIGKFQLSKAYITYRHTRALMRRPNTTDDSIMGLLADMNKELAEENSNKNSVLTSTQRDIIAGEVSKDISKRHLLPREVVQAHENGTIHFHDMDYFIQPIFNCCLVNVEDMLNNGTVINSKMIETPKSFQVACTVLSQIICAVSSSQHGFSCKIAVQS